MSRFDQPTNEPDYDRYESKPIEDVDVPDFEAPDPVSPADPGHGQTGRTLTISGLTAVIDPAEHAAHALIEALTTLEQQIVLNHDHLERVWFLKDLLKRAWQHVDLVNGKALAQIDAILERRR